MYNRESPSKAARKEKAFAWFVLRLKCGKESNAAVIALACVRPAQLFSPKTDWYIGCYVWKKMTPFWQNDWANTECDEVRQSVTKKMSKSVTRCCHLWRRQRVHDHVVGIVNNGNAMFTKTTKRGNEMFFFHIINWKLHRHSQLLKSRPCCGQIFGHRCKKQLILVTQFLITYAIQFVNKCFTLTFSSFITKFNKTMIGLPTSNINWIIFVIFRLSCLMHKNYSKYFCTNSFCRNSSKTNKASKTDSMSLSPSFSTFMSKFM